MSKRVLDPYDHLHIHYNESTHGGTECYTFKDVSKFKTVINFIKVTKKRKTSSKLINNLNMDISLSRKSTSDLDPPLNLDNSQVTETLREDNVIVNGQDYSDGTGNFRFLNFSSTDQHNSKEAFKMLESIERCNNINGLSGIETSKELNSHSSDLENQDDQLKENLTPSRRAEYIHTLLSGRTSIDNSVNLLNKISKENANDLVKSKDNVKINGLDSSGGSPEEFVNRKLSEEQENNQQNEEISNLNENKSQNSDSEKDENSLENDFNLKESEYRYNYEQSAEDECCTNYEGFFENEKEISEIDKLIDRYRRLYTSIFYKNGCSDEKLRVVVRCRPSSNPNKVVECEKTLVKLLKPGDKNSVLKSQRPRTYEFNFDYIVNENETTENLYNNSCSDLVEKVISGTSVTVFAYGSTGSGKTYTISGNENSSGLIYLTMTDLFAKNEKYEHDLYLSYFEVYNENVYDLLQENETNLQLQEHDNIVYVKGLTKVKIENYKDFETIFEIGNKNRKVFTTNANRCSSRSHAIVQIRTGLGSKLTFIDLAGSERMKITENTGERLKESSYINQSLLALINCINTLSKNSSFLSKLKPFNDLGHDIEVYYDRVKYRDSKLTHLLKNSLSGKCFIVMIAHVNPENKFYQDSYNTIKYALRAKNVEITQIITKGKCGKEIIRKFSNELLFLVNLMKKHMNRSQLDSMKQHISQSQLVGQTILVDLLQ